MGLNNSDIILRFLLDQQALGQVDKGFQFLDRSFERFEREIDAAIAKTRELKKFSNDLGNASKSTFLVGTAITGGIFAAANNYVKDAKEATAVTVAWKRAQDSLSKSSDRFGETLAQEALPLLEKAARLADTASRFTEQHPEIVRAALNTGVIVAGLGAVGIAVSKGIQLTAGIAYIAAVAKEQQAIFQFDKAVNKFLTGTTQLATSKGGAPTPGGGSQFGGLLTALLAFTPSTNSPVKAFGENLSKMILGIQDEAEKIASIDLSSAMNSSAFKDVLKAYEQYRRDDLSATQAYLADKQRLEQDAIEASKQANQNYAVSVRRVNSQLSSAISSATTAYHQEVLQAERENADQRAQLIRDAGEEVARIEQELQETLRKNRMEHESRTSDLVAARDALGLAKEQQRFNQEQNEARRAANLEIAQRRRDIAQRLIDLQHSYEQERAQRLSEYQARVIEIRANAAQQMREIQESHAAELRQIQQQKIVRIRELDSQNDAERRRRYQALITNIRDLDAALLGEQQLRDRYQAAMIRDLDNFLANYQSKLGGAFGGIPGKAEGGYASYGLYRLGDAPGGGRGGPEFVMNANTTRAAEQVIGGQLSQRALLNAMMGGGRGQITLNDHRRFDSRLSLADRRAIQKDTVEVLGQLFQ